MIKMIKRFGPAGIFSTDNPVSDAMQIEEESWDPEDDPNYNSLQARCMACSWYDTSHYIIEDEADYRRAWEYLERSHRSAHPDCPGERGGYIYQV